MEKNLSLELNEWWNNFDLIEKILIKDFLVGLCDYNFQISVRNNLRKNHKISEIKIQKVLHALLKKIKIKIKKDKPLDDLSLLNIVKSGFTPAGAGREAAKKYKK